MFSSRSFHPVGCAVVEEEEQGGADLHLNGMLDGSRQVAAAAASPPRPPPPMAEQQPFSICKWDGGRSPCLPAWRREGGGGRNIFWSVVEDRTDHPCLFRSANVLQT